MISAKTPAEVRDGRERVAMQRAEGLDVHWLARAEAVRRNSLLARDSFLGASYLATDGCIDPLRNVRAYSLAMRQVGVELREHTAFMGLHTERTPGGTRLTGIETSAGSIECERAI